jgi:hypothetical protein
MRFLRAFLIVFASSAPADASPTQLHRRGSEIIVELCHRVNNRTDIFFKHIKHMIRQDEFRIEDVVTEMWKDSDFLVQAFDYGARDIPRTQGRVTDLETKQVMSLRRAHHSIVQSLISFMTQGVFLLEITRMGRTVEITKMLEKQKDGNSAFATQVILKMPPELRKSLKALYDETDDAFRRGMSGYTRLAVLGDKADGTPAHEESSGQKAKTGAGEKNLKPTAGISLNATVGTWDFFECKDGICKWSSCLHRYGTRGGTPGKEHTTFSVKQLEECHRDLGLPKIDLS